MAQDQGTILENNFIGGLKTEFTGLNFPENACTETFDCVFKRTGAVERRLGFDYEANYAVAPVARSGDAINTYLWKTAGNGTQSLVVVQEGLDLHFYLASSVTTASSLSANKIGTINIAGFAPAGFVPTVDRECDFAEGNGLLFVYHPQLNPFYCEYSGGTILTTQIDIEIRDFVGIIEGTPDAFRPPSLTPAHTYNIQNQGWNLRIIDWSAFSNSPNNTIVGTKNFEIPAGLPIVNGDDIQIFVFGRNVPVMYGDVVSYSGTTLTVNVTQSVPNAQIINAWIIEPRSEGIIQEWLAATGVYPSNTDVWWYYKDSTGVFNPSLTYGSVSYSTGPAPKGFYILDAFDQRRDVASGVGGLPIVTSNGARPSTGCWFQGRVWYTGVRAPGFNERIYFSQIIERQDQYGRCYQANDPTSEERFDLLPSDGGEIVIQGSGVIHKLFPISNGLLVFADKGVWFITGSQGIGFTANDYTVTKISSVPAISGTSFVDVVGFPMWWNRDGIYTVKQEQANLFVVSLTDTTIASFYDQIHIDSKMFARGAYNPVTFTVQWIYRNDLTTNITNRYEFQRVLNLDMTTSAFYPWTCERPGISTFVNGIVALGGTNDNQAPEFKFKYLMTTLILAPNTYHMTFGETRNTNYVDHQTAWGTGFDYDSYFVTGYRVMPNANRRGQLGYLSVHADGTNEFDCVLQTRWDYTTSGTQGKWSTSQILGFGGYQRAYDTRRIRVRGSGRAVQFMFSALPNQPMNLVGWSADVSVNKGP